MDDKVASAGEARSNQTADLGGDNPAKKGGLSLKRLIPLLILVAGLVAFFATGANKYVSFAELGKHHEALSAWVERNGFIAVVVYMVGYAVMVAFSLPGGAVATIFAGFLFGTALATGLVVIGATAGATALFLAARTGLGEPLRARAGAGLKKMEAGFQENALSYMFVLRLVPVFPFWLVNLVPAFLGVKLRTYVIGTLFGIIPGTFVFASIGRGFESLIAAGKAPGLGAFLKTEILVPIVGLALLAMIPVVYKRIKGKKSAD